MNSLAGKNKAKVFLFGRPLEGKGMYLCNYVLAHKLKILDAPNLAYPSFEYKVLMKYFWKKRFFKL